MLTMLFYGSQLSLPYVVSVYLVRDLNAGSQTSEQAIGQLTGILAASQSVGRSLTALAWGVVSDKIGRKACILVGTVAACVSITAFGLSSSFPAALLARMLPSLFFGSAVALKSMIGDATSLASQATAMSIFNLGWAMGQVVGPVVGGSLSYPCRFEGFPLCGEAGLFQRKPFLLPCLSVGCLGLLALASNVFVMPETHPQLSRAPGGWVANLARLLCCRPRRSLPAEGQESGELLPHCSSDLEMGRLHKPRQQQQQREQQTGPASPRPQPEAAEGGLQQQQASAGRQPGAAAAEESDEEAEEGAALLRPKQQQQTSAAGQADPNYRWWRDGNVRVALLGSGLVAFLFCALDEMAPIFVSAPLLQGGLGLALEEFTLPLVAGGLALAVFSLAGYPRLAKRYGAGPLIHVGLLLGLPGALALPAANLLARSRAAVLACLYFTACCNCIAKICTLNSSTIAVNLVAPRANMGAVNGGAMTLQSGGRALGPIVSGSLWAAVVSLHAPGQQFLGFGAVAAGLVAAQFLYFRLRLPPPA